MISMTGKKLQTFENPFYHFDITSLHTCTDITQNALGFVWLAGVQGVQNVMY